MVNDDEDESESSTDSPYAEIEKEDERSVSVSPLDTYDEVEEGDILGRSDRGSVVSIDPPGHTG